jgi:hypothetical protein
MRMVMSVSVAARPAARRIAPLMKRAAFVALLVVAAVVPRVWLAPFPAVADAWSLLPFGGLVLVVLVDVRRPWQVVHLDLVVLLSLVIPIAFAGGSRWVWSMLLLYPQLVYLAARMVVLTRTRRLPVAGLRSQLPLKWLLVGTLVLVGVHVAWEVPPGTYMDVAYDSVRGALRIIHGLPLYGGTAGSATYGPSNFLAYVPFAGLISHGQAASRLATLVFTMLTALLLFLLGRRERGSDVGLLLAFCWLALPFTLYEDATAFNDSLIAATIVATLLCLRQAGPAGAAAAVAGWTKFSPLALVPLLVARRSRRDRVRFLAAFTAMTGLLFVPAFAHSTPAAFLSQSFGYQAARVQQNTIWAALSLSWSRSAHWLIDFSAVLHALTIGVAVTTALLLPRLSRREDVAGVAAASATILLLFELCLNDFAYSYIVWFAPLVLIALVFGQHPAQAHGSDRPPGIEVQATLQVSDV